MTEIGRATSQSGSGWADVDTLARKVDPAWSFLHSSWFTSGDIPTTSLTVARAPNGAPLAAFPMVDRRRGPLAVREMAGSYWPFRGVPLAMDANEAELAEALRGIGLDLGKVWRLGPVAANEPALTLLLPAARDAGWRVLRRPLGTLFELDLATLASSGAWPSTKTQRKNRWRMRRLEEQGGPPAIRSFTGADWTAADRDAMAAIETASWLGKLPGGGDTKFRDPAQRRYWEGLCDDPALAAMIFGSMMTLGGDPVAFTFGIAAGGTSYYIANNYDDRFTQFGPGRVLLYEDFARAAQNGAAKVSWGLGDAGYKTEMGALPGPELVDLLFVRNRLLAAVLRPLWERQ